MITNFGKAVDQNLVLTDETNSAEVLNIPGWEYKPEDFGFSLVEEDATITVRITGQYDLVAFAVVGCKVDGHEVYVKTGSGSRTGNAFKDKLVAEIDRVAQLLDLI